MSGKVCAVYMMTNSRRTTLYIGVTSDLVKRGWEHKNKVDPSCFTARYNLDMLVWYQTTPNIAAAIEREKQIKAGSRRAKLALIEAMNPERKDLWADLVPGGVHPR